MNAKAIFKKLKVTDIRNGVVISRPEQMYGWPGMVKTSENEIIVAASERRAHVCPYGREVIVRSADGGKTWSLPQEIYNSELDDRDANLTLAADGTLMLSWFTSAAFELYPQWAARTKRITNQMREELLGSWMSCSRDGGHSWDIPKRMPAGRHISPIILSDNSLLVLGDGAGNENEDSVAVYKSDDMGESWRKATKIPCKRIWIAECKQNLLVLDENHVLETSPGKLIAMFRTTDGEGYLYQAFSEDYGESWSKPYKTDIMGFPPHLLRLSNGVIMCSYSHRWKPFSIRAVFSYNDGKNWDTDNILTLYEWKNQPDMGYPSSIELSPGNILTVFYCSHHGASHQASLPEGILSVTFKLEDN